METSYSRTTKMPEAPVKPACTHLDDIIGVFHGLPRPGVGLAPYRHDACSADDQVQCVHHQREDDEAARILDARLLASAGDDLCARVVHQSSTISGEQERVWNPVDNLRELLRSCVLGWLHNSRPLECMTTFFRLCTSIGEVLEPCASLGQQESADNNTD